MSTIRELIKDNHVEFLRLDNREGVEATLWYRIVENGFEFPVPVSDTEQAVFEARSKAILMMRWIRKHYQFLAEAKEQQ